MTTQIALDYTEKVKRAALIILLLAAVAAAAVVTLRSELLAAPTEIVDLPPPTIFPHTISSGIKTQFLVTVPLPAAPALTRSMVQILTGKGKWKNFGPLNDNGAKGDTTAGDGLSTLLKSYRLRSSAITFRISAIDTSTTVHVSLPVSVTGAGMISIPAMWNIALQDPSLPILLTNDVSTTDATNASLPESVGVIKLYRVHKDPSLSLNAFAQREAGGAVVVSSSSEIVSGHPAVRMFAQSLFSPPTEYVDLYIEDDTTTVTVLSVRFESTSPNSTDILAAFDSVAQTLVLN